MTTFDAVPVGATHAGTPPDIVSTVPAPPFAIELSTPVVLCCTRPAAEEIGRLLNVMAPDDVRPVRLVRVPAIVLFPAIVMPPAVVLMLAPAAIVPTTVALPPSATIWPLRPIVIVPAVAVPIAIGLRDVPSSIVNVAAVPVIVPPNEAAPVKTEVSVTPRVPEIEVFPL